MLIDKIGAEIKEKGILCEKILFKQTKNKPLPTPPYVIYYQKSDIRYGGDFLPNAISKGEIGIEIYVKNLSDGIINDVEEIIEKYDFEKNTDFDTSEGVYILTYFFKVTERVCSCDSAANL